MNILGSLRGRGRYTVYGALFGALFPLISWLIIGYISRDIMILFGVICSAPFFLGVFARLAGIRQDRLDGINRNLEALVAERTSAIRNLLDASGQGFLSFGQDFIVDQEYSRECERLFGCALGGERVDELLYAGTQAQTDFRSGLGLFFRGSALPEVIFDLLDPRIEHGGKTLRAEYRAIGAAKVLAIFTDITEDLRREREAQEENDRRALILAVIANRRAFSLLEREAAELFPALLARNADYASLLRELHGFKGHLGFLAFKRSQGAAHELEDFIADRISLDLEVKPAAQVAELRIAYVEERGIIAEALGQEWLQRSAMIEVPRGEYRRIEELVRSRHPEDAELVAALESHRMQPLARLFDRFPSMAEGLAQRLGKRIEPLVVSGGSTPVLTEDYEGLVSSFAHVLRNMLDHGIEPPGVRESAGKPPAGKVAIDISENAGRLVFTFSDDGRGIRIDEVEHRARELGLAAGGSSPDKLIPLIFRDGFSTSASVTSISGRGVGLPAVREELRRMGGSARVGTERGRGTVFTFTLPMKKASEVGS